MKYQFIAEHPSTEQARSLKQPPVYILGLGQASPGGTGRADREPGIYTSAKQSGEITLRIAGIERKGVTMLLYHACYVIFMQSADLSST